jgi:AcrR family transcriptional regulator
MAIDRRVARTRNSLYDALITMIVERGYAAISVEDILRRANVGRSTFYSHFTSKDDLLARSLDRLGALLEEAAARDGEASAWSLTLFEHVGEYRTIYLALSGIAAGDVLRDAVRRVVIGFAQQRIERDKPISAEVAVAHVAATFLTVVAWWLERRPRLSPREADGVFRALLGGGVRID